MIVEYHRPQTIELALTLLARPQPITFPMGGGTILCQPGKSAYAVVDLQGLGLNQIKAQGNQLIVQSSATLHNLLDTPEIQPALREAIRSEANPNIRQVGTVAGTMAAADGRSAFATAMMALDAHLIWLPDQVETSYGDWLPLRADKRPGLLIYEIHLPLQLKLSFHAAARTPADLPIVSVAVGRWPSGRTRVVVGGFGSAPILAMDGPESNGAVEAVQNVLAEAGDDWASSAYRQDVAGVLVKRCLSDVEAL